MCRSVPRYCDVYSDISHAETLENSTLRPESRSYDPEPNHYSEQKYYPQQEYLVTHNYYQPKKKKKKKVYVPVFVPEKGKKSRLNIYLHCVVVSWRTYSWEPRVKVNRRAIVLFAIIVYKDWERPYGNGR